MFSCRVTIIIISHYYYKINLLASVSLKRCYAYYFYYKEIIDDKF